MNVTQTRLLEFFEKMVLIRKFEDTVYDLAKRGVVHGSVHLCSGEEAPAVGACAALTPDDCILPTHRGHGQFLAKGADPNRLLAEIIGREAGYCKGRVGSMHLFDTATNTLGSNGIVGAQFPMAVGIGLALKLQGGNRCLICFFGDGASNQGMFYEALNLASLWDLPIIFLCIDNQFGMGTRYAQTSKAALHEKAQVFRIHAESVDGNDVEAIYAKMVELVAMVKTEKKPAFLECSTYRIMGHSAFDVRNYRPKEEIEAWKQRDPILRLEQQLLAQDVAAAALEEIRARVAQTMAAAETFAVASPLSTFDLSLEQ